MGTIGATRLTEVQLDAMLEGGVARKRRFWGWGYEGEGLSQAQLEDLAASLSDRFGLPLTSSLPPRLEDLCLRVPRLKPPASLEHLVSSSTYERASHCYGKSYRDVLRAFRGEFTNPPDVVAFPETEGHIANLLDWCCEAGVAAIPYGGGSSVTGGVEPDVGDGYRGAVTIDLARLCKVLEVDRISRAARIQAGAYGPAIEDQLRPHGLTLRHFPQSFEVSSLGGWIATRSGGHFATVYTHIDEMVESLRAVTPAGIIETRRLPGSGAGPSPDRLLLGSEGILGVITEAWMRLHERPRFRASAAVRFATFEAGVEAARAISQSGLYPANCRLLDPVEALTSGTDDGSAAVLLVGFESADHPLDPWIARAAELCSDHGGRVPADALRTRTDESASQVGSVGAWRSAFMRAPYLRDALVAIGILSETFETAITWERFEALYSAVMVATKEALETVGAGTGWVTCRFTHVYPDGPAPYFTVVAPSRRGGEIEQWEAVKQAASSAVLASGGTITHHHSVGRDHRRWYDQQRPDLFGATLIAAKKVLDPEAVLNPGVLVDSPR